ncbi:CAF17-like 4Fe-4S cluster assembly/insertion protein YgfZ [Marinitenerispora sediminis]|uniref:Folate-binding protein YgfZ n=1 Tax=Marinitenerispora sediminis TaxID=1931232 RepID=A0A368TAW6_9ACTN|nr:glycine cleavage T C-terminal barrel domain-containing protein [Marinitenerispora sediminis]RCV51083.1 folate-binding protein YgfZ [Marinitenerispora sediminis]RCV56580.1 folate-binding protein YgfZ [Marinitenerispora sediminis]RCV60078.1 folate-binding protein YgfZ [Marinitenerispora sediminis]
MTSPLLQRPGAVAAEPPDADIAAHYGEPAQEQRALERAAGWIDRSDRGVVRISGPDRLGWLHSLTSQYLDGLTPGSATEALIMDTKGHVQHHLALVEDGESVWAHVEPGGAPELARFLESMRFLLRVEVADLSAERAVLTLAGPDHEAALASAAGDLAGVPVRRAGEETDLFLPAEALVPTAERLTAAGVRPAGLWAYEARRIAAHRPRLGLDTDHRAIPHEMGWIGSAVHLEKGCYPGQETVARVHNLGRPPRRLVLLHLDGTAERLPARGAAVELAGRQIGFVGSSARHHELGPIALALVKRTAPVDAELLVDGIAAAQEVVVRPDTGANVQIDLRRRPR